MGEPEYIQAHKYCSKHRDHIKKSDLCGCFYCLETFKPSEIVKWTDEVGGEGSTALCPKCGIDSVIGSASGFPITEKFLNLMKTHWFKDA